MGRFHIVRHGLPAVLVLLGLAFVLVYGLGNRGATSEATATRQQPGLALATGEGTAVLTTTNTITASPLPVQETASATPTSSATATPSPTPSQTASPTPIPPTATPTRTPSPTNTPPPVATVTPLSPWLPSPTTTALRPPEITPTVTVTPLPSLPPTTPYTAGPFDPTIPYRERFGIASGTSDTGEMFEAGLPIGSNLNWRIIIEPPLPAELNYWQMVRVSEAGLAASWTWQVVEAAVLANPGSIWIVGNEPDVVWQDNVTPERYAHVYYEVYTFIKNLDPAARVAIGGISQSTPLRRAYLDRVLDEYRANYGPMPIDIWTVHAFTLREEADSWGVDIPPGMSDELAIQYEIADHGNIAIFQQNLIDFREWMAEQGYADRPLAVTEYGILMPDEYGFPPELVADFMTQSFDFFLNTAGEHGYAPDGGRLVQWWFWYSIYNEQAPEVGNLYDRAAGGLTWLGDIFADYVNNHE